MIGFLETSSNEISKEIYKPSKELPFFSNDIKPKEIFDFSEADKPLFSNEVSNSEVTKSEIKEHSPYSDDINKHISSLEELEVYIDAGLKEVEINGRPCLCRDIDLDYKDTKTGLTNKELMEKGLSPIDKSTGEKIELHHIGQGFDSPLAELTADSEHGNKYSQLHQNKSESWRNNPTLKNRYNNSDKPNHWKSRVRGDM